MPETSQFNWLDSYAPYFCILLVVIMQEEE